MNTILVQTTEEAERLTRLVTERGLERVRLVSISEIRQSITASVPVEQDLMPLLNKVRVTPEYEAVAKWWFGNVFIAQDISKVFEYRKTYPQFTFISPEGHTVGHQDRSLSSGKTPTKTGVFARRREIEDLGLRCEGLNIQVNQLNLDRENLLQHLQNQEKLHGELKDKLSVIHIESVEARKEREKLQFELSRLEREQEVILGEINKQEGIQADTREKLRALSDEMIALAVEGDRIQKSIEELSQSIEMSERESADLNRALSDKKIERSTLFERKNGLEGKIIRLDNEIQDKTQQLGFLAEEQESDATELQSKKSEIEQVLTKTTQSQQSLNQVLVQLADMKGLFQETCTALSELRIQKDELQKRRENIFSEIQDLEIQMTHAQSLLEQLKGISNERYHCDPQPIDESVQIELEKLPLFVETLNVEWTALGDSDRSVLLEEHLKSMKEKIARYGEVNLTAIQEFDDIQKRYDFLIEQKSDLENSIQILEDAIKKIEETTRVRFTETFEAVNKKFSEIFPILFNGGKAELTLVYQVGSTDPGVDIMAQPPGKRLQSITLLSGGEKALTAVSLVLAIFARKPSPFCLLDEVDAPLDDANVSRFNTVVKKMAEKTQFIVITHNKKTMEIAEALYGVTMQRNGISKMASVSLQ
jgi:chromosome segregation protein